MNNPIKHTIQYAFLLVRNVLNVFLRFSEKSIFCYHGIDEENLSTSVTPKDFESHILYLQKKGYRFVALADMVAYIKEARALPKKAIAITFDDGYRSVYENAFPLLLKYKIPATIFIVENPDPKRLGNSTPILFDSEIATMKETGLVTFGNHSKTHRMLDTLSGDILREEVGSGTYFAYPGGHHSPEAVQAVKNAGYTAAFSIRPGVVRKGDNPFLIRRSVIIRTMPLWIVHFHATASARWYYEIARGIKRLRR